MREVISVGRIPDTDIVIKKNPKQMKENRKTLCSLERKAPTKTCDRESVFAFSESEPSYCNYVNLLCKSNFLLQGKGAHVTDLAESMFSI